MTFVVLAACTGPSPPVPAPTAGRSVDSSPGHPTTQASNRVFSHEQLQDALLTVADLPNGWRAAERKQEGPPSEDIRRQCSDLAEWSLRLRGAPEADFTRPDGTEVDESIWSFPEHEARKTLAGLSAAVAACKGAKTRARDGTFIDVRMILVPFPQIADEAFAYSATWTAYGISLGQQETAVVRRGGVLVSVSQDVTGAVSTALTEDIARRAVKKINEVLI
ncbi:hypothetical protein [Actinoplanes xinjiangensis]|uniref:hypothetical protein n=1 Tax=Actinoplanes xinjiangensis TaxID=512350 RepID=UPI0034247A0F